MWESFLNGVMGAGDTISKPLTGAWDYLNTPKNERIMAQINAIPEGEDVPEELLAQLADEENDPGKSIMENLGNGLQALGQLSPRTGQQQTNFSGGGGRSGGGTNIQTRDEYSEAMKALLEKYGHLMTNKDF